MPWQEVSVVSLRAEFVALAEVLAVPLVTADRIVLRAFPDRALAMEAFAQR